MTQSDIEELAALFILGVHSDEQGERLRERTSSDPAAELMLEEYAEVGNSIALLTTPVEPPASVRESLLAAIAPHRDGFKVIGAREDWQGYPIPGVTVKQLSADDRTVTLLFRLAPECVVPPHVHQGRETCYVIEGSYRTAGREFRAGDFVSAAPGTSDEEIRTEHGATLLVVMAAADFYAA